jgi:deoxycytidylate deaminase
MKNERFFYMTIALEVASASRCLRSQVGAILVKDGNIIAMGYNGTVTGFDNCCEAEEMKEHNGLIVSSRGRIFEKSGVELKQRLLRGYLQTRDKLRRSFSVSNLVADAFIENPDPARYSQVNHINGIKTENDVYNLEHCTNRFNCEDRTTRLNLKAGKKLPISIGFNKVRKKFEVRIYAQGKLNVKRFDSLEEAVDHKRLLIDPLDLITYRYKGGITKPEVLHAESNCLMKCARSTQSSEGADLYVTMSPCFDCAKLIIQAGVRRVFYHEAYRETQGLDLLTKANIYHAKI